MKSLAIALSGAGQVLREDIVRLANLTNVQCKTIWNCHKESPLYNEYTLIKMEKDHITNLNLTCVLTLYSYLSQLKIPLSAGRLKDQGTGRTDNNIHSYKARDQSYND
jgi:hypothetical protein